MDLRSPSSHTFEHHYFGALPSTFQSVATNPTNNIVSTIDTIRRMIELARAQASSPIVQQALDIALSDIPLDASVTIKLQAIFQYVKSNVRFVEDEATLANVFGVDIDKELLITPERLLTMPVPAGDCDDFSTLTAAMVIGLGEGVGVAFSTIAAERMEPENFSHVYVVAYPSESERIVIDTSHGPYLGWETREIYTQQEWVVMPRERQAVRFSDSRGNRSNRSPLHGIGQLYAGELAMQQIAMPAGSLNLTSVLIDGINTGIQTTARVFESKYGGAQPGTYVKTAEGGITYRLPTTQATIGLTTMPDFGTNGATIQWLLIGVGVFGVLMFMTRKGGK